MSLLAKLFSPFTRAFYEGGRITKANRDFHNATSPFETTASPDRDILRARARWLQANNPIMANIDKTIVNNTIGRGIGLQLQTENKELNAFVQSLWREYCSNGNCDVTGRLNMGDMQSLLLTQRMVDGEILVYKRITNDPKFPLKAQIIEVDRLVKTSVDMKIIDGVEMDDNGKPTHYHISNSTGFTADTSSVRIPADDIINYFKIERATQYRGVSEYKQAIIDLKNFSAFQSATIQAARARATVAYYVKKVANTGVTPFGAKPDDDGELINDINGVMVHYLNQGEEMGKLDPDVVGFNYGEFTRTAVRMFAVARNISYELAFRDYSQVNFASSRSSIIQDNKRFDAEQEHFTSYVMQPWFEAWMDAMVLNGSFTKFFTASEYFANKNMFLSTKWVYPAREWVDPIKDMKAIEKELSLGLTTKTEVAAKRGKEYADVLRQIKHEEELELEILGHTLNESNKNQPKKGKPKEGEGNAKTKRE